MAKCFDLKNLSAEKLPYISTTIAVSISKCLDDDEVSVWSSIFFGIGSALSQIEKQRSLIKNKCKSANNKN